MKGKLGKCLSIVLMVAMLLSVLHVGAMAEALEPIHTPIEQDEAALEPANAQIEQDALEDAILEDIDAEPVDQNQGEPAMDTAEEIENGAETESEAPADPEAVPANDAPLLSNAQIAALQAIPEGFNAQIVAAAMLSSSSCAHALFGVRTTETVKYTRIDDETHRYMCTVTQKQLYCFECGTTLQTISVNETDEGILPHDWVVDDSSSSPYDFKCDGCDAKKRFAAACAHTNVYQGGDGNLHCSDCGAITYIFEKNECEHKSITIIQPDTEWTWYEDWNSEMHVKQTYVYHNDNSNMRDAECDDCGISIICDRNGNNRQYGTTDTVGYETDENSVLEAHSFANGVCAQCGYKQQGTEPDPCDHSAGNYNDVLDADVAPVYSNITETTHCVQHSYKRYCKDCGAYIGNVTDEGIVPEAHDFGSGNTCACGYQKVDVPEDNPYVRGFTMSNTAIKIGDTVAFTLDIANAKAGDVLTVEFNADKWTEEFELTYPNNVFEHKFSQDGNRSIRFRVKGGDYCAAQTLIVEADKAGIDSVKLANGSLSVVEKAAGETIRATITCNNQTGVVEMYVGKHYTFSTDYRVVDGRRVFEIEIVLGGNGKSYVGNYKIVANALKGNYQPVDATSQIGTLEVKHAYTAEYKPEGTYYKQSVDGHTLYEKTKKIETCSVCDDQKETIQTKPIGSKEPHVGMKENGKCSVCGYRGNIFETANSGKDFNLKPSAMRDRFVIIGETPNWNEKGKIRYVEQWSYDNGEFSRLTYASYWGNMNPTQQCTRAAASMAFSYMGKNVLPKDIGKSYTEAAEKVGCTQDHSGQSVATTEQFIQWYNDYAADTEGRYSPVVIYTQRKDDDGVLREGKHAFTIIGRDGTNPNCFYIADSGNGNNVAKIYLTDVNGELRIEKYIVNENTGKASVKYDSSLKVISMWRYALQK